MARGFPTATPAALSGEAGVNFVASTINQDFGWIFRRTHGEHDFGVDGYVDIVTSDGGVTGRCIAVQIKHGTSFFSHKTRDGYTYYGEEKHLNYLSNHPLPVLLIICDVSAGLRHWVHFEPEALEPTETGWKIHVPFENKLDASSKQALLDLAGPPHDYLAALRKYWTLNKALDAASYTMYVAGKRDIESSDFSHVTDFFERLQVTRAFARRNQGIVDFSIHGYDGDPRELWQIPEVVRWIKQLEPKIRYWLFFLRSDKSNHSLRMLMYCVCDAQWAGGPPPPGQRFHPIQVDPDALSRFLKRNFDWLREITTALSFSPVEFAEIRDAVVTALGVEPLIRKFQINV